MSFYIPKRNLLYAIENLEEYYEVKLKEGEPDMKLWDFIQSWKELAKK